MEKQKPTRTGTKPVQPNNGATLDIKILQLRLERKSEDLYVARGTINKQNREIERLRSTINSLNNKLEAAKNHIWEQSKRLAPTDLLEAENQRLAKRVAALEAEVSSLKRTGNPGQAQSFATMYLEKKEECLKLLARLREYEREYGVKF